MQLTAAAMVKCADLLRQLGEGDDCSESETAHAATLLLTHARAALHAHLAGHTSCDSVHAALAHSNRLAEVEIPFKTHTSPSRRRLNVL